MGKKILLVDDEANIRRMLGALLRDEIGAGETVEATLIKQRLDLALARSEVPVKASCFCRSKVAA